MFTSRSRQQAHALYTALVAQSRKPFLYKEFAIPDTLDGRFDALVLHMFLLSRRLKREPSAQFLALARLLQEAFVADMDRSLREMGVGDTGVGKRVKQMAGASAGRFRAYEVAAQDEATLMEALKRNVYRNAPNNMQAGAKALATYVQRCMAALERQESAAIAAGAVSFPDVAGSAALRSSVAR